MEKYSTDTACTGNTKADHINSRVLEWASDVAEELTERDCIITNTKCYNVEMEGETEVTTYTEEAQDIFNEYYDAQVDSFYNFLNTCLEIEAPTVEEKVILRLGEHVSEEDVETAYEVLKNAQEEFGDRPADDYVLMWEPLEGRYTVNQLLEIVE